jgi:colanic acid biosynthesis glycosyl transferase WcaI
MRITVWGINYAPEVTGIGPFNAALCDFLAAKGHEVTMVTSFPYYPEWRKREADLGEIYRTERGECLTICRCWHYVPKRITALRRMVHEASFVATSLLKILSLRRPDVMVVVSPPLLLGVAAWCAGFVKRSPFLFHVQDLQPDAAVSLGMLRDGVFARLLYRIEWFSYRRASRVLAISKGMMEVFRKKGVPEEKIALFPNGVRLPAKLPPAGGFRVRHGISEATFLAIYSGNLGAKQGLEILVEAGKLLAGMNDAGRPIKILIAGDGARRATLAEAIEKLCLENLKLLPLQEESAYREMLNDADCTLITQQKGTGSYFFPSKLLASLATGKPVLTVADAGSELAKAVREGGFGWNVAPGDAAGLADAIRDLAGVAESPASLAAQREEMGRAALRYAEQFEFQRVLADCEAEICAVAGCVSGSITAPSEPAAAG